MQQKRFDRSLVRSLLQDQHPDLATLPLRDVPGGWDNHQWRLGDSLAVRLPRSERAPDMLVKERTWLPDLAARLSLPTPVPVRVGEPSAQFPHTWTIARWVAGTPADITPITDPDAARALAEFLRQLHHPSPADAPVNPPRGLPMDPALIDRSALVRLAEADEHHLDVAAMQDIWAAAAAAAQWPGPARWLHGDLHPANITVLDGTLAGVLDFGDLCSGDPAFDLSAAWVLLPAGLAEPFFAAYGQADEATIVRARGWALWRALGLLAVGRAGRLGQPGGKPTWEPAGYATLRRLTAT